MGENRNRGPHQAKNKPLNYGSSNAIFGESVSIQDPNASADERKTVILDEDLEGLEFEDRVWLYWKRNKTFIVSLIVLAFVVIIGKHAWISYTEARDNSIASEFAAADTFEKRGEFAKAHSGIPAAGVALLENADSLFEANKFAEAAGVYKSASENLGEMPMYGRALLGEAVSVLKSGKVEEAKKLLASVAENPEALSYSAEAAYHLGVLQFAEGKVEEAKKSFESVLHNQNAGRWSALASAQLNRISK